MIDILNDKTNIGSDTIVLGNGIGIYSLASPVTISAVEEEMEIMVYTDNNCVQMITQLAVKPILFEF